MRIWNRRTGETNASDDAAEVLAAAPDEWTDVDPRFDGMTVHELRDYAAEHGIDLGGATKKADILAVLSGA